MKRRILSIALGITMLVGLLPTTAMAGETHTAHAFCGVANCTDSTHNHSEVTEWVELTTNNLNNGTLSLEDGKSYYLGDDITVSASVEISGTVNLCLNGKTLSAEGGYLNVENGGTLNLCSCGSSGMLQRAHSTQGKLINVASGATLHVYNTTIDGGAVWEGTLDGVLRRGTNNKGISAANVLLDVEGTATLNKDAVLQNNVVKSGGGTGGAVTVRQGGSLTINGAVIKNNANNGENGGAIKVYGDTTLVMNSGEIYGNYAIKHGGAIQIWGNHEGNKIPAVFTMNGGTIHNNKAGVVGGAIAVSDYSSFIMNGGEIKNNATTDSSKRGGGVGFGDNNTSMTVSGSAKIYNNAAKDTVNNLYIGSNTCNKVNIGTMADDAQIFVTMAGRTGVFSSGGANYKDKFQSDNSSYAVYKNGADLMLYDVNAFTVTYTDNVDDEIVFDDVMRVVSSGGEAPAYGDNDPNRRGYKFGGWYKETACVNKWDFDTDTVTSNTVLYAKWIEDPQIVIHYNAETGGTVSIKSETLLPASGVARGAVATADSGYHFIGWYQNDVKVSSDVVFVPAKENGLNVAATYTAKFEADPVNDSPSSSNRKPKYDIKNESKKTENGTVEISRSSAAKGKAVTITVTPDEGYQLDELLILDKNGNEVEYKDNGDGTYSFVMPAGGVEVDASFEKMNVTFDEEPFIMIFTIDEKEYQKNDAELMNDVAPVIRSDRTMLPIRVVAENLGATVTWNEPEQSVTIAMDDKEIVIYVGQLFALVDGCPVELDSPAFIANDRTYLPMRFVAENLGATVTWDGVNQTVTIVG